LLRVAEGKTERKGPHMALCGRIQWKELKNRGERMKPKGTIKSTRAVASGRMG